MAIALTEEQTQLAESVSAFTARLAPVAGTRERLAAFAAGGRPDHWPALVDQGLHRVHLDEEAGGDGGSLLDLAVVAEQAGRALLPGPFLPTVTTSAVVAMAAAGPRRTALLKRFADGATGAIVLPDSALGARRGEKGWVLSGRTAPVLGLLSAEVVVVGAEAAGEALWFAIEADAPGVTRVEEKGVDLTRDVGRLELSEMVVGDDDRLAGLEDDAARTAVIALYAAEVSGVMSWFLDTAVEYVKVREQFGRPVGSFQAVKHKAARLFITTQFAAAAAWDAARSLGQDAAQRRLAMGCAAIAGPSRAADAGLEAITLLGGIGFTWEHDIHLYWRRAISLAGLTGPAATWTQALGAEALDADRDFGPDLAEEDAAFRAWVGEQLDAALALPSDVPRTAGGWSAASTGPRRTLLADSGLIAPHWPKPYGLGASPVQQLVVAEEFAKRGLPQPSTVIGEWAMPTILAHGTEQQKERFAGPTLRGELVWCQLFSEPGAGSDLAGLSTRAVKVDGGWRLDGQKVWTSSAHEADWGICLARTDPEAPKHKGLSFFIVDMRSAGVDVRPLKQVTGAAEFNEVFLNGVFVPDDCLLGRPGEGWRLTATTLANERLTIGSGMGGSGGFGRLREAVRKKELAAGDGAALQVLGRAAADRIALGALGLRETLRRLSGLEPGVGASVIKVGGALADRERVNAALGLLGPEAALNDGRTGLVLDELSLPSVLLGGGTVEIQLNVISERILGLPR
jgi:alkylation response protein AidB-like acyl-CoA dehydrogenase